MPFNLMNAIYVFSTQCCYRVTVYSNSYMYFAENTCAENRRGPCTQAPNRQEYSGKTPQVDYTYCHGLFHISVYNSNNVRFFVLFYPCCLSS